MGLFKKNTQLVDLLNKFNNMENKIDILNNKFEMLTFLDGCCDCKKRENKIYTDLQEFLENKLLNIKQSLLEKINSINAQDEIKQETKQNNELNLEDKLKNVVEDVYNKHRIELINILQTCCESNYRSDKVDLYNHINNLNVNINNVVKEITETRNNLTTNILNVKTDVIKDIVTNSLGLDASLRSDLQTFLVGLQTDMNHNMTTYLSSNSQQLNAFKEDIDNKIKDINDSINNIGTRVNEFYYENEGIKHQLLLEEEIRGYNDEIDNVKILATHLKDTIEIALLKYEN